MLSILSSNAQDTIIYRFETPIEAPKSSGDHLIIASNSLLVGSACMFASSGIIYASSKMKTIDQTDKDSAKLILQTGVVIGAVGLVTILVGYSHIGKAGKMLNKDGTVYLKLSEENIGLSLNF